jgi:hypothetical protein
MEIVKKCIVSEKKHDMNKIFLRAGFQINVIIKLHQDKSEHVLTVNTVITFIA